MKKNHNEDQGISLQLSRDQALVYFAWLSRFNDDDRVVFDDQAEQRVLWDIQALLEKELAEPFTREYQSLLEAAREAVRDSLD